MLRLFWLIAFSCLISCTPSDPLADKPKIPSDSIISEDQMVLMLADIHLADAGLLIKRNRGEKTDKLATKYYEGIFQKYHISADRYQMNLDYYRQDFEVLEKLYEKVVVELKAREQAYVKPRLH